MQCGRNESLIDTDKRGAHRTFDRWCPGVYAFARREDAKAFRIDNGGVILTFGELMKDVPHR
jgi:hypothetical protein